jgi:hypothetical protein
MLIDDLDKSARERLEAISTKLDGLDMPLDQKTAVGVDLTAVKDLLGALDVRGLKYANEMFGNILNMLLDPTALASLEPLTGMLLSFLFKFGGGGGHGQEQEGGPRPGIGMER